MQKIILAPFALVVACGADPSGQPSVPATGCDIAPGGRPLETESLRFERDGVVTSLVRRVVDQGIGSSSIYELDALAIERAATCIRVDNELSYENSHHNWRDRARGTQNGIAYELSIDYRIEDSNYWQVSLQADTWRVDDMVTTGAPMGCWQCPGFVPVWIYEVQVDNMSTIADDAGEYDPWVELFNPTSEAVDLSGYGLSNDPSRPMAWTFLEGTTIGRHEILMVWLDGEPEQGALHTSMHFQGGWLRLTAPDGSSVGERKFETTEPDHSYVFDFDSTMFERTDHPTPGVDHNGS